MEKLIRCLLLIGIGFLVMASTSWSQASEAEMRAFPMPPAQGYARQKHLAFRGDYGNYLWPYLSYPNLNIDPPADYVYVRYTGISEKRSMWRAYGGLLGFRPQAKTVITAD